MSAFSTSDPLAGLALTCCAGLWSREGAFGSNWTPCPILEPGRISEDVQGRDSVLKMPGRGGRGARTVGIFGSQLVSHAHTVPFCWTSLCQPVRDHGWAG